jgi:hypothetical protein
MIPSQKAALTAEDRAAMFHETFDVSVDAGATLAQLVRAAGDYLARIVGNELADAGMAKIIQSVAGTAEAPADWRGVLADNESGCFSEWPLGQQLHTLAAYAHFGIALLPESAPDVRARDLEALVASAVIFRDLSPLALWLGADGAPQLEQLVLLAENRWALDNGKPVDAAALTLFGGVSEGRLRNMMSGAGRVFTPDADKKIPAQQALAWLADRDTFWPSIWRDQALPQHANRHGPPLEQPVFVPVGRDGSVFHPGLRRRGTYTIGEKGEERHVADFEEALAQLQKMPTPAWRRPLDEAGKSWGLVSGIRWERLDRAYLEALTAVPQPKVPRAPGWDAKLIHQVANEVFGGLEKMFEYHDWPERGDRMMPSVQRRVKETYGSVEAFEAKYQLRLGF